MISGSSALSRVAMIFLIAFFTNGKTYVILKIDANPLIKNSIGSRFVVGQSATQPTIISIYKPTFGLTTTEENEFSETEKLEIKRTTVILTNGNKEKCLEQFKKYKFIASIYNEASCSSEERNIKVVKEKDNHEEEQEGAQTQAEQGAETQGEKRAREAAKG